MNHSEGHLSAQTTSNLKRLEYGPTHRGAVEQINEMGISGWCIAASDPKAPVFIEIVLNQQTLATMRTFRERQDVGSQIGQTVYPGFEFSWVELPESSRQSLLAHLRTLDAGAELELVLRLVDAPIELDASLAKKSGTVTCGHLAKALATLPTRPRISHIAAREAYLKGLPPPQSATSTPRVRALAFYLPQFHAIPENDEWWGKGFTEWTNVASAQPSFAEHDQPRFPSELGYYDLRTPGVIEAQIELAKTHGLAGFCFHHYWFGGQRLLQYPLERFLEIDHDFGFCICWANEPWSRRWDGSEHEVLMPQPHSMESDIQFIRDALPILQDRRYVRVDSKPVLIVYRVDLFKQPTVVFDRWRDICIANGLPGLHICMAETFGSRNPWEYGCDSAVEFPPHAITARQLNEDPSAVEGLHPRFKGQIYEYAEVVANQIVAPSPEYPRYPTVMLGWDNTSRRGLSGHVFRGFTVGAFEAWLEHACQTSQREFSTDARLVFINAWNEWGEGTYLEPDRRNGRRYLETVKRCVFGTEPTEATFQVLKHRLQSDASAIAALERIQERVRTLESTLIYTLENGRQRSAYLSMTALSTREPPACYPRHAGGRGHIDRMAIHNGSNRRVARRGEVIHLSGWVVPWDRVLTAQSPAYLKLAPCYREGATYFGAILNRLQREDIVRHFADNMAQPEAPPSERRPPSIRRIAKFMRRDGATLLRSASSTLTSKDLLWSGFSTAFPTDVLSPGHYSISVVFPMLTAGQHSAVDVLLDASLEVVE